MDRTESLTSRESRTVPNSISETAVSVTSSFSARRRDDVRVELGHQRRSAAARGRRVPRRPPARASTTDSARASACGIGPVGDEPSSAGERVRGAADDRTRGDQPPLRIDGGPDRPPERHDIRARRESPVPSTTRLRRPPSQTPLIRRNAASCTPATASRIAIPAAKAASVHVETAVIPLPLTDHDMATAVNAICAAIAMPIEVKNQDGVLMRCASIARDASASLRAADASAALGRCSVLSISESIRRYFPIRQVGCARGQRERLKRGIQRGVAAQ